MHRRRQGSPGSHGLQNGFGKEVDDAATGGRSCRKSRHGKGERRKGTREGRRRRRRRRRRRLVCVVGTNNARRETTVGVCWCLGQAKPLLQVGSKEPSFSASSGVQIALQLFPTRDSKYTFPIKPCDWQYLYDQERLF